MSIQAVNPTANDVQTGKGFEKILLLLAAGAAISALAFFPRALEYADEAVMIHLISKAEAPIVDLKDHLEEVSISAAYPGVERLWGRNAGVDRWLVCADGPEGLQGYLAMTGSGDREGELLITRKFEAATSSEVCTL